MSRRSKKSKYERKEIEFDRFLLSYQRYPFGKMPWKFRITTEHRGETVKIAEGKAETEEKLLEAADQYITERLVPMLELAAAEAGLRLAELLQEQMANALAEHGVGGEE